MASPKKKKASPQKKTSFAPRKAQSKPLWAIVLAAFSLLYFVALYDFHPDQTTLVKAGGLTAENMVGAFGAELAGYSIYLLGMVAWGLPLFILWLSFLFVTKRASDVRARLFIAFFVCVVSATGIAKLAESKLAEIEPSAGQHSAVEIREVAPGAETGFLEDRIYFTGPGGLMGEWVINDSVKRSLGVFGSSLVVIISFFVGLLFLVTGNLSQALENFQNQRALRAARPPQKAVKQSAVSKREPIPEPLPVEPEPKKKTVRPPSTRKPVMGAEGEEKEVSVKKALPAGSSIMDEPEEPVDDFVPEAVEAKDEADSKKKKGFLLPLRKKKAEAKEPVARPTESTASEPEGLKIIETEQEERVAIDIPQQKGDYEFPPLSLLSDPAEVAQDDQPQNHHETAANLVKTLEEFSVKVSPGEVHTGPVITRYEVKPAPGVRVEKILNLDKNIALGLRAEAVRILAPVPGKGTVGIEVPNKNPLPVCMREIIESRAWAKSKSEIPVVLGKDVTGKPIVEDLTKMPHMLIAGSTGSGKTVCINAIIASLLYHSSPDDLRFIMVDPKVVEMQVYNSLPHMLIPVVTDPKKVPGALKYLINEMERRYQIFAKVGVRNIAGFNAKIVKDKAEKKRAAEAEAAMDADMSAEERVAAATLEVPRDVELEIPEEKMHYIVCIIDELADLMMVAPQDIETGVARIAQLARAAGIHLILATQRPSVNVITGVIKANLPTRISFKVASKIDSRTILDGGGAEALIGKGDMLFVPPGTSNLVRAQGAFVSDDEINEIVEHLKVNGPPRYVEKVQQEIESSESGGSKSDNTYEDELVPDAIGVLKASKRASTSMLQRRLKIGYNRAARIMEILEDEGIVGPENGSSPREILMDLDAL